MISPLRIAYLAFALWGAIHPMYWFATYMRETGTGLFGLMAGWQANAATMGQNWEVAITALALVVWIIAETRVRRNWSALAAIPATYIFGTSCGLPLYLFLRTRPVT